MVHDDSDVPLAGDAWLVVLAGDFTLAPRLADGLWAEVRSGQRDPCGMDGVERIRALDRCTRVSGPDNHTPGRLAPARGQRDVMGDVPLRVAVGRAQLVDTERQRRGEPRKTQPPASDHAGVGQRVKLARCLFDSAAEPREPSVRVSDRAVDPDSVDAFAALLVQHRGAEPLPPAALSRLLAGATADADVHRERRPERTAQNTPGD